MTEYGSMVAAYGAPPPPTDGESFDGWYTTFGSGVAILAELKQPPWRRGPLAAWTLVNIACFDGRLTIVMKRGRGELIIESGPDDDAIWERLAMKVVKIDEKLAKEKGPT